MKNKIIICLSFCFILFIGLNVVSAASFTIDDVTYDVPEFDSYIESSKFYIIYREKDSTQVKLQYIPSDKTVYDVVKMEYNGAETNNLTGYGSDGVYSKAYTCSYNLDTNEFKAWSTSSIQSLINITLGEVYACSMDIYNSDGSVFFPLPVQEITLAQVLEKNSPVTNFQTMMSGIIPYLIAFMIGLLAFWKGWRFLSNQLRKA